MNHVGLLPSKLLNLCNATPIKITAFFIASFLLSYASLLCGARSCIPWFTWLRIFFIGLYNKICYLHQSSKCKGECFLSPDESCSTKSKHLVPTRHHFSCCPSSNKCPFQFNHIPSTSFHEVTNLSHIPLFLCKAAEPLPCVIPDQLRSLFQYCEWWLWRGFHWREFQPQPTGEETPCNKYHDHTYGVCFSLPTNKLLAALWNLSKLKRLVCSIQ